MLASRAPVKPRTISPETGDVVPLEDAILSCVEERKTGVVQIIGRHGSGRTWALQHLLAVLPPRPHVRFVDNATVADVAEISSSSIVVCGSLTSDARLGDVVLRLTPWGNDDLIEFLLAVHPQQCQSVMRRLNEDQYRSLLNGLPE